MRRPIIGSAAEPPWIGGMPTRAICLGLAPGENDRERLELAVVRALLRRSPAGAHADVLPVVAEDVLAVEVRLQQLADHPLRALVVPEALGVEVLPRALRVPAPLDPLAERLLPRAAMLEAVLLQHHGRVAVSGYSQAVV